MIEQFWPVMVSAMLPISELRGSIPLGILVLNLNPLATILVSIVFNMLVFFPVYIALHLLYHRFFERFGWARGIIERIHRKGKPFMEKYELIGLVIFVGIPLPFTGAWTGTGIAWLFGLNWKNSFLAIALGVLMAAAIVSVVVLGGLTMLNVFVV